MRLTRQWQHRLLQYQQQLAHFGQRLIHPGKKLGTQQAQVYHLASRLHHAYHSSNQQHTWRHQQLAQRLKQQLPSITRLSQTLLQQQNRLHFAMRQQLTRQHTALNAIDSHLKHLSPSAVLLRGYSLVRNEHGEIIRSTSQISVNEKLNIHFAEDSAEIQVRKLHKNRQLKK